MYILQILKILKNESSVANTVFDKDENGAFKVYQKSAASS